MNAEKRISDFFSDSSAKNLNEEALLREIIVIFPADSAVLYDLTFHSAFAKRIFEIIKREGPQTQGFQRMQQSFLESVETVRGILMKYEADSLTSASPFTGSTPQAKARLSRLVEDLALLKNWLVSNEK